MFKERYVKATAASETAAVKVDRGYPKKGVLSPLLWSLVVDNLLARLDSTEVFFQGYASDIVDIIRAKFEKTVASVLQGSFTLIQVWYKDRQLGINPKNTCTIHDKN